ncbi:MAG: tRNA (guanosine(37)-N1)-methyltransferase TrmD [Lentisphaeria bacterium]|nr:tRNA (guanosine(37)-N1)-methyltransferase TrmD [Lentisphaeria bacterium]
MRIDILTLFPELFPGPLGESIIGRAAEKGMISVNAVDVRKFAADARGTVDERPYGGGPGMLMVPDVLTRAIESVKDAGSTVILTSPRGEVMNQKLAQELADEEHLILVAGHYEGVDQRVIDSVVDREISIGDFVLSNGNIAAMAIADAVIRLLPGVLGDDESAREESHSMGLLEYPQYTRPPVFRGMKVPDLLLSGDHGKVAEFRKREAERITRERRPDLWEKYLISELNKEVKNEHS